MKPLILTLNLLLLFSINAGATAGGVGIGNGGDSVFCSPSAEDKLSGYYSLDYLMTLDGNGNSNAANVQSWDDSVNRIRNLLINKYPVLAVSFQNFVNSIKNNNDWTQPRIWLAAPHGLVDISDEQMRRTLPANCGQASGSDKVTLIQTVVRSQSPKMISYEFDTKTLQELQKQPIQYSFLLVHEWLWDHTDDPKVIRWANQFLHAQSTEGLSSDNFKLALNNIGISAGYSGLYDICRRTTEIRKQLENITKKSCGLIEKSDLDLVTGLEIGDIKSKKLDINDLNSLSMLQNFVIRNSDIEEIPKEFFGKNPRIEMVGLINLKLNWVDLDMFHQNTAVKILELQLPIKELDLSFAVNIPDSLTTLFIRRSELTDLPLNFFNELSKRQYFYINFVGNKGLDTQKVKSAATAAGFARLSIQ